MRTRLEQFGELDAVQQRLVDEVGRGEVIRFGKAEGKTDLGKGLYVPNPDDPDAPAVDAAFLRYLILGGCDALPAPIPASGVQVAGLRIGGALTLGSEDVARDIILSDCLFDTAPNLSSARMRSLFLNGSHLPGLQGDRLSASGTANLSMVVSTGEIRMGGADIGCELDFSGAKLTPGSSRDALFADGIRVRGQVNLRSVSARQEVRLLGANLGGNLDCRGAKLTAGASGTTLKADGIRVRGNVYFTEAELAGTVRLSGARVDGVVSLETLSWAATDRGDASDKALTAEGMSVGGALFIRPRERIDGKVNLAYTSVGSLVDRLDGWPEGGRLWLDRFTYGAIIAALTDAASRIAWCDSQHPDELGAAFKPQPWEQCAKVLREGGHGHDARAVLIAKEERQRRARREVLRSQEHPWKAPVRRAFDWLLWWTTDYGRWPLKAGWSLLIFFAVGWAVFAAAGAADQIKPNNPVVLRSIEWARCAETPAAHIDTWRRGGHPSQRDCFEAQEEAASYPRFQAGIYSLDTLLPIVAMEMQGFWIPDETTGWWGWFARGYLWIHIAVGWGLSLLAVAGFSGLIRTDNT